MFMIKAVEKVTMHEKETCMGPTNCATCTPTLITFRMPSASYKPYNLTCPIFVVYLGEEGIYPLYSLKMMSYYHIEPKCHILSENCPIIQYIFAKSTWALCKMSWSRYRVVIKINKVL